MLFISVNHFFYNWRNFEDPFLVNIRLKIRFVIINVIIKNRDDFCLHVILLKLMFLFKSIKNKFPCTIFRMLLANSTLALRSDTVN